MNSSNGSKARVKFAFAAKQLQKNVLEGNTQHPFERSDNSKLMEHKVEQLERNIKDNERIMDKLYRENESLRSQLEKSKERQKKDDYHKVCKENGHLAREVQRYKDQLRKRERDMDKLRAERDKLKRELQAEMQVKFQTQCDKRGKEQGELKVQAEMIAQLKLENSKLQTEKQNLPIMIERLMEETRKEHMKGEEQRREELFKTVADLQQENKETKEKMAHLDELNKQQKKDILQKEELLEAKRKLITILEVENEELKKLKFIFPNVNRIVKKEEPKAQSPAPLKSCLKRPKPRLPKPENTIEVESPQSPSPPRFLQQPKLIPLNKVEPVVHQRSRSQLSKPKLPPPLDDVPPVKRQQPMAANGQSVLEKEGKRGGKQQQKVLVHSRGKSMMSPGRAGTVGNNARNEQFSNSFPAGSSVGFKYNLRSTAKVRLPPAAIFEEEEEDDSDVDEEEIVVMASTNKRKLSVEEYFAKKARK